VIPDPLSIRWDEGEDRGELGITTLAISSHIIYRASFERGSLHCSVDTSGVLLIAALAHFAGRSVARFCPALSVQRLGTFCTRWKLLKCVDF